MSQQEPVFDGSGKEVQFGHVYYLYHRASGKYIRQSNAAGMPCELTTDLSMRMKVRVDGEKYGDALHVDKYFELMEEELSLCSKNDKLVLCRHPSPGSNLYPKFKFRAPKYFLLGFTNLIVDGKMLCSPKGENKLEFGVEGQLDQQYAFVFIEV